VAQKANLSFKNKFPYISVLDEASDLKFGMQLEFAKAHHQIPPEEKVGVALAGRARQKFLGCPLVFLQWLKLATSNLVHSLCLPRPVIKSHTVEKVGCLELLEFPFNIYTMTEASDFKFGTQLG